MINRTRVTVLSFLLAVILIIGFGCNSGGNSPTGATNTNTNTETTGGTTTGGTTTGGTTGGTTGTTLGTITVTAGTGTTPQYSWVGENVWNVQVYRADVTGADAVWSVVIMGQGGFSNSISSPLLHGTVPAGAVQGFNNEPVLTSGVRYFVEVSRLKAGTTEIEAHGRSEVFIP